MGIFNNNKPEFIKKFLDDTSSNKDNEINKKSSESDNDLNSNKNKYKEEIFTIEKNKLDYGPLNLFIKIGGTLLILILTIIFLMLIAEFIISPFLSFISILTPFILGIVFAWLINPLVTKVENTEGIRTSRTLSSTILTLSLFIVISIAIILLFYITTNQILIFLTGGQNIPDLISSKTSPIDAIELYMNDITKLKSNSYEFFMFIGQVIGIIDVNIIGNTTSYEIVILKDIDFIGIIMFFIKFFITFFISMIVAMYILPSFANLSNSFKAILPKKYKKSGGELIDIVGESFTNYMRGALFIAFIVGSTIALLLFIITIISNSIFNVNESLYSFNINDPASFVTVICIILSFGVILSVTNLIPYIGPFIGGTPVVILTFLSDGSSGYWITFAVLGSIIFVQSLESMFLQPTIMGRQTRMHPVVILLGLTIFGALFGPIGLLISTPIIAIGKGIVKYYDEKYGIF